MQSIRLPELVCPQIADQDPISLCQHTPWQRMLWLMSTVWCLLWNSAMPAAETALNLGYMYFSHRKQGYSSDTLKWPSVLYYIGRPFILSQELYYFDQDTKMSPIVKHVSHNVLYSHLSLRHILETLRFLKWSYWKCCHFKEKSLCRDELT